MTQIAPNSSKTGVIGDVSPLVHGINSSGSVGMIRRKEGGGQGHMART